MPSPDQLAAWQRLSALATRPHTDQTDRFARYTIELPGLFIDFSKQRIDHDVLAALLDLAEQAGFATARARLFSGATVNVTEQRPALHTALRAPAAERPSIAGDVVDATLARVLRFAAAVRTGEHRGHSGKTITDIVHIGIGGSHLGPELAVEALTAGRAAPLRCHFVANVDGHAIATTLRGLDPARTLFVVVSKSFATLETQVNAASARSWFLERVGSLTALRQHFVGITANVPAAQAFGIEEHAIFPMWDWVGGRFSLWSAVGLPIALCAGPDAFLGLLAGARAMDEHFLGAAPDRNMPLLMALAGIWNYDFLGATNQVVLPYDQRLRLLPDYLQQLEMESNGKRVSLDGQPVSVPTMPIVWGGEGTNGQHAFHQLLHQGTSRFAADFILVANADHTLEEHQRWLLANGLAQSQAMLLGHDDPDPHRRVTGNKPTTTIVLDALTPGALGALLALYEHKVFCQGVLWNINSFDQWGVELGKRLALPIHDQLRGQSTAGQDASTAGLVAHIRARARNAH
ncbi:MAG: glucose-6-phosphate isomerase [Pseudomonadales bacterium]|nr:glucose-6-phosphate isomerase [Pseudomonadales bacterium]